jgi:hypothetical protein
MKEVLLAVFKFRVGKLCESPCITTSLLFVELLRSKNTILAIFCFDKSI